MRQSGELQSVSSISYKVGKSFEIQIEERLGVEALSAVIMNFYNDCIDEYGSLVAALDREVDFEVPIIFGRSFLATGRALVNMEKGQMKFRLNSEEVTFNICRSMRQSGELQSASAISYKMGETF